MSQSIYVRSIDALGDFRTAILRYRYEAGEVLASFDYFISRTREWLQDRMQHWQKELRHSREDLRFAELALGHCRSSGRVDENGFYRQPDCARYEIALSRAQARVRDAEGGVASALLWEQTFNRAIEIYEIEERRLKDIFEENVPKALGMLELKLNTLAAYVAIAPLSEPEAPLSGKVHWPAPPPETDETEIVEAAEGATSYAKSTSAAGDPTPASGGR